MVNWVRTHTHIFKEIKRWIFIKLIFAHFYLHSAFIFTLSPLKRKMLCLIPQSIATKATYTHTHTYMDGISWVLQPRHLHNTHTHTHMHVYIIVLPCTQNQHEICLWPKLKCICNNPCVCVCVNLVLHPPFYHHTIGSLIVLRLLRLHATERICVHLYATKTHTPPPPLSFAPPPNTNVNSLALLHRIFAFSFHIFSHNKFLPIRRFKARACCFFVATKAQ